ncbi:MAG: Asp23/Gls24 family envelope stress response protein [Halanaerobiaceae bacterium]
MQKEWSNELGQVSIVQEVIEKVAGLAAMECYGLVGMSARNVQDGIAELLGWENLTRGVLAEIQDDRVELELNIVVEYGTNIHEVANNIIEKVKYTLEDKVGIKVKNVRIIVQGVRVGNAGKQRE